jgi:hypothetical protein
MVNSQKITAPHTMTPSSQGPSPMMVNRLLVSKSSAAPPAVAATTPIRSADGPGVW